MKQFLAQLMSWIVYCSGLPFLFREIYARRKVTIVNYHNPKPNIFKEHAQFFSRNYSFVSIDQVVDCLEKQTFSRLPPNPLLITFDDGYADNALLFPILHRYHIPATIYAVAGVVGTNRHFWFDKLPHHGEVMRLLKQISDKERRQRMITDYAHLDEKEYEKPAALSVVELQSFMNSGGTVGSHTLFHPLLDKCEEEVAIEECRMSRMVLENLTGKPVTHFALPNGNINESVLRWIQQAGYRSCRTTVPGWVVPMTSPFLLPTFGIDDNGDYRKACLQASGLWDILKAFGDNIKTFLRPLE